MTKLDTKLCNIWVTNISKLMQSNVFPMKSSHLCSKHLSADMFEKACYSQRAALKSYAV